LKKRMMIVVLFMMCALMGGCLKETPLTDAELDIVAEYAADLLLEYDKNYKSSLLAQEELEEAITATVTPTVVPTETPVPTGALEEVNPGNPSVTVSPTQGAEDTPSPTPSPSPIPENSEETNVQLTQVVGTEGFYITYEYYELKQEVISNEYFSLEAKKGRQYMLVHFLIHNTTEEMLVFDATEQKIECSLDINLGTISRVSLSMLANDLQYMPIEVAAGSAEDSVLVFEISAEEEINTAHLVIMNKDDEAAFVKLK